MSRGIDVRTKTIPIAGPDTAVWVPASRVPSTRVACVITPQTRIVDDDVERSVACTALDHHALRVGITITTVLNGARSLGTLTPRILDGDPLDVAASAAVPVAADEQALTS